MNEIILNLWAYYDVATDLIHEISGRAYRVTGDDQFKLNLLNSLAPTDHETTQRFQVPSKFYYELPNGLIKKNVITFPMLTMFGLTVFEEFFLSLEQKLPSRTVNFDGLLTTEVQMIPKNPLVVITPLKVGQDGIITPVLTNKGDPIGN